MRLRVVAEGGRVSQGRSDRGSGADSATLLLRPPPTVSFRDA
jgi:hypothetical protein